MRELFELLFCPVHGLFRPDNTNALFVLADSRFCQTVTWVKHKTREIFYERTSKQTASDIDTNSDTGYYIHADSERSAATGGEERDCTLEGTT